MQSGQLTEYYSHKNKKMIGGVFNMNIKQVQWIFDNEESDDFSCIIYDKVGNVIARIYGTCEVGIDHVDDLLIVVYQNGAPTESKIYVDVRDISSIKVL